MKYCGFNNNVEFVLNYKVNLLIKIIYDLRLNVKFYPYSRIDYILFWKIAKNVIYFGDNIWWSSATQYFCNKCCCWFLIVNQFILLIMIELDWADYSTIVLVFTK